MFDFDGVLNCTPFILYVPQGTIFLEEAMYTLTCEASFDAAHFLTNYEGKCANIHGHRWRVILAIKGDLDNGMVVDFNIIKKDLKELCDKFDHTFIIEKNSLDDNLFNLLNDKFKLTVVDFRTTAENFSKYFYDVLNKKYDVSYVEVYETPNNCRRYSCE